MKKPTDFSRILASYLTAYLPSLRNVTRNTVSSYCDTFRLLLTFCRDVYGLKAEDRISDTLAPVSYSRLKKQRSRLP